MSYFIGIDTSTTATKALLMNESGNVLGVASNEYDFETPRPLWSEQDPALWWTATVESTRQVIAKTGVDATAVKGIGLTGQMHGLVLLDKDKKVVDAYSTGADISAGNMIGSDIFSRLSRSDGRDSIVQEFFHTFLSVVALFTSRSNLG